MLKNNKEVIMDLSNKNIIYVKESGIEYIQFKILLEYGLINCFTTKINNFDLNGNLDKKVLEYNYRRICSSLGIERDSIARPWQTHSDNIQSITEIIRLTDTDGFLTNIPGINLTLSFADCTPILIFDPKNKVVGNIHSGWKGTAKKIGPKAVLKMCKDYGSKPEDLIICIGPCIRQCHFEVQDDVKDIFEKEFGYFGRNNDMIKKEETKPGKYMLNSVLAIELSLEDVGVNPQNIYDSGICTICNSNIFHSYRADKEKSGRNVAIIGLKK